LNGQTIQRYIPELLQRTSVSSRHMLEQMAGSVIELNVITDTGEEFPAELAISRVRFDDERLFTAIIRDISERRAQQRQLQFQATHDPLTTLPNRPALAAHLDSLL